MGKEPAPVPVTANRLLTACSNNILAVAFMKLIKVLELAWYQGQVVCGKSNSSTHNNQLSGKVIHHKAEELIGHAMPLANLVFA